MTHSPGADRTAVAHPPLLPLPVAISSRRYGFPIQLVSLLALCVHFISCSDSGKVELAVDALKSREIKIVAMENAALQHDAALAERERQLAESAADLAKQREEIASLRATLEAEILKTRHHQDALLRREKRGPAPSVQGERVIVVDANSGDVLLEKNADKKAPVASTQKLLTALILAEAGQLDQIVTVEEADWRCAPVRIGLKTGEQYPRRQLLTALMLKSSNDIAQALARDHSGSMESFVVAMNVRAKALGMADSRFVNPHGLPAEGQYSTARDMARVALAVDANRELRGIIKLKSFVFKKRDGSWINLENTNRVLKSFPFCDGMKTGYIQAAGYCLVASGEKDGQRRIVIVLSSTSQSVWKDSQSLLEWSLKA